MKNEKNMKRISLIFCGLCALLGLFIFFGSDSTEKSAATSTTPSVDGAPPTASTGRLDNLSPEKSAEITADNIDPVGDKQAGSAGADGADKPDATLTEPAAAALPAEPVQAPPAIKVAPPEPVRTEHKEHLTALEARKEMKTSTSATAAATDTEAEMVRIQEVDYVVPEPWAGNRVRVPYDTAENLVLIPTELTLDAMEIALRKEALAQLKRMAATAREEGVILQVDSGYRSANYQREIYERRLGEGQSFERIARHTAPPGYSGHALGTAVDFHPSSSGFQKTRAYRWLKQHAKTYGFHETYYQGNAFGISWEPWHWEYKMSKKKPAEIVVAARKDKAETPAREVVQCEAKQIPADGGQADADCKNK